MKHTRFQVYQQHMRTFVYICAHHISKQISIKVMVSDETHPLKFFVNNIYVCVFMLYTLCQKKFEFEVMALDEAHSIKNAETSKYKKLLQMSCMRRILLTGEC